MNTKTLLTAASAALVLALAGGANGALAQTNEKATVTVSYGDLNMHSPEGARVALARIRQAAAKICGPEPSNLLDRRSIYAPCVKTITDQTVASVNFPMLTAANSSAPVVPEATLASTR